MNFQISLSTQVFSTEICENFKDTYFYEHLYLHVTLFAMPGEDTVNEV